MNPSFQFSDLPVELVLIILRYSAQPTFDQAEKYRLKCPYSSALKLCLVSKYVRRAVLPELLHTILLPDYRNVRKFVQALVLQEAYKKAGSDLYFDYVPHVHRMWIGFDGGNLTPALLPQAHSLGVVNPREYILQPSDRAHAISLLTPILFAASSLAFGWTSVDLLIDCLEQAWKSHPATPVDEEHFRPPWNTQTLMLSHGTPTNRTIVNRLTSTPQGSAFLASIRHLSGLTALRRNPLNNYHMPEWMGATLLASFKSLESVTLPYTYTNSPISIMTLFGPGISVQMELLTLSATLMKDPTNGSPNEIEVFNSILPGKVYTRKGTRLQVSHSEVHWCACCGWEKIWALVSLHKASKIHVQYFDKFLTF
ncbi:hypothetical protein BDR07DRAFT_1465898 [Suillus spraguei]|nr:hypothetical protein BDR07DRAFT_1465898 [Suillus spraguei]